MAKDPLKYARKTGIAYDERSNKISIGLPIKTKGYGKIHLFAPGFKI